MRARTTHQARRLIGSAVIMAMIAAGCSNDRKAAPSTTGGPTPTTPPTTTPGGAGGPASRLLAVKLSQGKAQFAPAAPTEVVDGSALDPALLQAIIDRLPAFEAGPNLVEDFRWPTQTITPPRPGAVVDVPFPPADAPPPVAVPTGPVEVLRHQPDGDVPIAPYISVTFNQPMVPIGTLAQLDQQNVPAVVTPALDGRWQWIGTRTLRFDFESADIDRLPMATEYAVTVPAGTKSASGEALADDVSWTFTTPPVTVQSFGPQDDHLARRPVFVATFDQRVDPQAVIDSISVRAGDADVAVRLATAAEIDGDDLARQVAATAGEGRWLAFQPVEPMPTDAAISIEFSAGTPSAEGPRQTTTAQVFRGRTYAPLRITDSGCGGPCYPGAGFGVTFNNALDPAGVDPSTITIEPALAGASIGVFGNTISVSGDTLPNTDYQVTIPAAVTDTFGQTLGGDETRTIAVGGADPQLQPLQPLITLDPMTESQTMSVISIKHEQLRLRVFTVSPGDWPAYERYVMDRDSSNTPPSLPKWPVAVDTVVDVGGDQEALSETAIDLGTGSGGTVFGGKPGHAVVIVEPTTEYAPSDPLYYQNRPAITWVQSTRLGVDVIGDTDRLVVWATDLRTGSALPGVSIAVGGASAVTGSDGLTTVDLGATVSHLVATSGDDTAILTNGLYGGGWSRQQVPDDARWFTFSDRGTYRPGETVRVKGWVRRLTLSGDARLQLLGAAAAVSWTFTDAQGNELGNGSAPLTALGGFEISAPIAEGANLGQAYINLTVTGEPGFAFAPSTAQVIDIQEFRRPEFEVVARSEGAGPFVSSRPATVAADANYYAGGPLGAAPVSWRVSTATATYSPPDWDEFTFGIWQPWWLYGDTGFGSALGRGVAVDESFGFPGDPCCFPETEVEVETFDGTTDGSGSHYLQIDFTGDDGTLPDLPTTVTAEATVTDVNRQAWASRTNLLVHPADFYVGLRSRRTFVRPGESMDVDVIVTDIDGKAVAGRTITVTVERMESKYVNGQWTEVPVDAQTCDTTSAAEAVPCAFTAGQGGSYRITSVVADDNGGRSRTELTRWVSGADARPARSVEQEQLTVVPDKPTYAPGDTAELLVQSPFAAGEGLVTVSRNGVDSTIRFTLAEGSAVVEVPISDEQIPNLDVSIEVVGAAPRIADDGSALPDAPPRPAFATGALTLSIPPVSRTLTVTAEPRNAVAAPGASTQIDVTVNDASGAPVAGAEFSVVVVDEAVLALSSYTLGDPLDAFYGQLYSAIGAVYGRSSIMLADPAGLDLLSRDAAGGPSTTAAAEATGGNLAAPAAATADQGRSLAAGGAAPIGVRSNFDALALFEPSVTTAADGSATIPFTLPDTATRYRVMVVAVSGDDHFGSDESTLTARLPLTARPSAPRFANFGDRFELPVVIQNQTDQPMEADVVLQMANLTSDGAAGPVGKHVSVPANDRIEVRFPVSAAQAGTGRFRVAAVSGDAADAVTTELPIYTPATAEAFATYGVIDGGVIDGGAIAQPLLAPTGVVAQFGGLEISTSSTSLQALTDAVLYISDYRYDSSDGHASRIMSFAALRPVLEAFDAEGLPSPAAIDAAVNDDIAALVAMQNDDGGWPYWRRNDRSEPFNSVQVMHALVLAAEAGFQVPAATRDAAAAFVATIESHIPAEYSQESRDTISAYALSVRNLAGDRDAAKADDLYERRGSTLQLDAIAWLWPVIDDSGFDAEIERLFTNRAVETAGAANFTNSYGDDAYLIMNSDRRTDGIVLDALISERPASDLIPKVVNGLLGHRTKGRWDNIQENAFILLALKHYFDVFEAQAPDFVARVWLGQQFAGEHAFAGRQTDRARVSIPTTELITAGDTQIVLAKEGTGRLYYRLGLRYAPESLHLDPLDRGFVVDRVYEAVDDPADVSRDADGTWHIKAGASVRVRLTMVAESQRTQVALIDPLPAGLEIINPSLAVSQTVPGDPSIEQPRPIDAFYWWGAWYNHQNARDDRAEAYATLLPAGTYSYSYVARATTPGTFVTPPTRAEEIYTPETFGRTATDTVVIGG